MLKIVVAVEMTKNHTETNNTQIAFPNIFRLGQLSKDWHMSPSQQFIVSLEYIYLATPMIVVVRGGASANTHMNGSYFFVSVSVSIPYRIVIKK